MTHMTAPSYPVLTTEEEKQIRYMHPNALDVLNHYGFSGQQDFSSLHRMLVIDEGNGDALIFLAAQLRHTPVRLTYLATNSAMLAHVKARIALHQFTSIDWLEGDISCVAKQKHRFDYISCTMTLDQLGAPLEILQQCKQLLTEEGVMLVKLAGYYGQLALRQMRELIERIETPLTEIKEQIHDIRVLLEQLPARNWYQRTSKRYADEISRNGDRALYEMFLAPRNQGYTTLEIMQLVADTELHMLGFVTMEGDANRRYNPETLFTSATMQPYLQQLTAIEKQALAEIAYGSLAFHYFYVSPKEKPHLTPRYKTLVPFFASHFYFPNAYESIATHLCQAKDPLLYHEMSGQQLSIERNAYTLPLCQAIDGKRSIEEIIAYVLHHPDQPVDMAEERALEEFTKLYQSLHRFDWMLLRAKHVPDFPKVM